MPALYRRDCPVCASESRRVVTVLHRSNLPGYGRVDWSLMRCECSHAYLDPMPDDRMLDWTGAATLADDAIAACGPFRCTMSDVLGRVRNPVGLLRSARKVIAPRGVLVVEEPKRLGFRERMEQWFNEFMSDPDGYTHRNRFTSQPTTLNYFTPESVRTAFDRAGWSDVDVRRKRGTITAIATAPGDVPARVIVLPPRTNALT